jgi:large subunit ribosomal protein L5e
MKLGLDDVYKGNEKITGEIVKTKKADGGRDYFVGELDDDKRPFRCLLDVGVRTTTTGNRLFAAMKVQGSNACPYQKEFACVRVM